MLQLVRTMHSQGHTFGILGWGNARGGTGTFCGSGYLGAAMNSDMARPGGGGESFREATQNFFSAMRSIVNQFGVMHDQALLSPDAAVREAAHAVAAEYLPAPAHPVGQCSVIVSQGAPGPEGQSCAAFSSGTWAPPLIFPFMNGTRLLRFRGARSGERHARRQSKRRRAPPSTRRRTP